MNTVPKVPGSTGLAPTMGLAPTGPAGLLLTMGVASTGPMIIAPTM